MEEPRNCPQCGSDLPAGSSGSQCLGCLLQLGLSDGPCQEDETLYSVTKDLLREEEDRSGEPDRWIGRYRLLMQIGEGGFGIVHLAEQVEPVRRRVALKEIKPGMDTHEVIARFEVERQALALMDHASIAKVFDGGTTTDGRPYFVMEFVDGVKITDYCDSHSLSVRERLALFVQVCQAVQHAHQKGVIHRDLKPSNILVAQQDGKPVPKVIDFGIAKATLGRQLGNASLHTALQQFAGTPAYMSPEQAGLGGLDVDSRSDIYSLGMLLYELLTARPAFDDVELARAALDEIFRTIREKDPPRPSARLTTLTPENQTTVARQRRTEPATLRNHLRGDLDWIVMKALEKNRNRRYETASGLAMDINRHLANEAVLARPPDPLYRLSRLVRRNQLLFAGITAVAAALICGIGLATWSFYREKAARQRAVTAEQLATGEASRSRQVAAFLSDMLRGVGPSVAQGRDTRLLREILDKTVMRVGRDLKEQPEVEADLRLIIGGVYRQLGAYPQAETIDREALALRRRIFGNDHPKVADALNDLANVLCNQSKLDEAESVHRDALAMRRKWSGDNHLDVAASQDSLGVVLWQQGKLAEAESSVRQALATRRKLLGNIHEDVTLSLDHLGLILSVEDKLAEAETIMREAVTRNRQQLGDTHPDLAISLNNLADTLHAEGKLAEAAKLNREILAKRITIFGDEHPAVAASLNNLATVLCDQGKLPEAEATHRRALAMRRKLLGASHLDIAGSLNNLAAVLIQENLLDEAESMQREALAIQLVALGTEHQDIAGSLDNLAFILMGRGKPVEAETSERQALAMRRRLLGGDHLDVALSLANLAHILQAQPKLPEAETLQRQALELRQKLLPAGHPDVAASLAGLADVLHDQHKFADAEGFQQQELTIWRERLRKESPHLPGTVSALIDALSRSTRTLLAAEKPAAAETLAREGLSLATTAASDSWQLANIQSLLGACLSDQRQFAAAETLLLDGYKGLKTRENSIPPEAKSPLLAEAGQRLVRLYQSTNRPTQATEWNEKLKPTR